MEKTKNNKALVAAILLVIFAVVCCSSAAVFVRYSTAPTLVLAAYRKSIVTLLLLPVALTKYREELFHLDRKNVALCALSGVFLAFHFFTYFESVQNTTISASQVLTGTEVLFMALFMFVSGKERYGKIATMGIVVAILGSVLVALTKGDAAKPHMMYGNISALICAVLLTSYSFIGAGVRKSCSNTVYTFIVYGTAAVVLNVMVAFSKYTFFGYDKINWLTALGMAVFASLLGHSILNWALKYLSPTLLAVIKVLQPVLATIWGLLFFREIPTWNQWLGGIIVIGGIILYIRAKGIEMDNSES